MARPRADLPDAAALLALCDAEGRLALHVTPGARSDSITLEGATARVKVRAAPEDGKATVAVLALVAKALGVATSRVELVRGATSREKVVRIRG